MKEMSGETMGKKYDEGPVGYLNLAPNGRPKMAVALARPDVQKKFLDAGTPVTLRGPEEFAAFVRAENQRWLPVIKASGAKIE